MGLLRAAQSELRMANAQLRRAERLGDEAKTAAALAAKAGERRGASAGA